MGLPITRDDIFAHMNDEGLLELVDITTGKVLAVQKTFEPILEQEFEEYELEDGSKVLLQKGVSLDQVRDRKGWAFSENVVDLMCTKIMEGMSLPKVCKLPGFPPYNVVSRWKRKHPEINESFQQAREDRAEYYVADALEIADQSYATTEEINCAKLKTETRKWIASKDAPGRYGNKVEVSGEITSNCRIETGIRRPGDPGFNKDETREIQNEKDVTDTI